MSDPLRPEPGIARVPANVNVLRANVDRYARTAGLGIKRVQQRVFAELVIGLLDNAKNKGVIPLYVVKGGMALELRFGIRARASGDLDIALSGDDVLALLDDALAVGFGEFAFERRDGSIYLQNAKTHRIGIKISYKGRAFGTIDLDINEEKAETATDMMTTSVITHLGLPGPLRVPIIDAHIHLAHKLHAATEPSRADYKNERYRDLIDALVIARDGNLNFALLRNVVRDEFRRRKHHALWPPNWALPDEWHTPLQALARLHKFEPSDPKTIEREIIALIARIEGVLVKTT
ncbi:MAG: nucleotidyl transferase AbiEii/AbiGii toxin family protein [Candidatus Eremiobacteraeota bacterium]|nr:nucleotidyl transferase AbiEii/AbiGii toxin family protein [Candidatus Eremiobacteraeota bacterium]